jgi:hypothetical protein
MACKCSTDRCKAGKCSRCKAGRCSSGECHRLNRATNRRPSIGMEHGDNISICLELTTAAQRGFLRCASSSPGPPPGFAHRRAGPVKAPINATNGSAKSQRHCRRQPPAVRIGGITATARRDGAGGWVFLVPSSGFAGLRWREDRPRPQFELCQCPTRSKLSCSTLGVQEVGIALRGGKQCQLFKMFSTPHVN